MLELFKTKLKERIFGKDALILNPNTHSLFKNHDDLSANKSFSFKKVAEIWNGQIFGELALLSNKPRAATVTCLTDCHFATLDKRTFEIIKKNLNKVLDSKIDQIR